MPDVGPSTPRTGPNALRAAVLGVVAGLRSMMPLAVVATHLERERSDQTQSSLIASLLGSRWAARGLQLAAAGELVGDKLPSMPSRLEPLPLAFRVVAGALAGAVQTVAEARPLPDETPALQADAFSPTVAVLTALVGALGAVVGSFAGFWLRTSLPRVLPLPALLFALAEDALAFALARWAARLQ